MRQSFYSGIIYMTGDIKLWDISPSRTNKVNTNLCDRKYASFIIKMLKRTSFCWKKKKKGVNIEYQWIMINFKFSALAFVAPFYLGLLYYILIEEENYLVEASSLNFSTCIMIVRGYCYIFLPLLLMVCSIF